MPSQPQQPTYDQMQQEITKRGQQVDHLSHQLREKTKQIDDLKYQLSRAKQVLLEPESSSEAASTRFAKYYFFRAETQTATTAQGQSLKERGPTQETNTRRKFES